MADMIGVAVTGDRKVALRFETFPHVAHERLLARIHQQTDRLESAVKAKTPKGATGQLQEAVYGKVFDDGDRITGFVSLSDDFAKAGALEWGARRNIRVSEHSARLDHNWSEKLENPTTVFVASYRRTLNIKPVRFLRDPLAMLAPEFTTELQQTVNEAAAESEA